MKYIFNNLNIFLLIHITHIYLTQLDAAYYIGISENFLQKLAEGKSIKTVGDMNKLYSRKELDHWVKQHRIVNA
jgi:hypothetical protein